MKAYRPIAMIALILAMILPLALPAQTTNQQDDEANKKKVTELKQKITEDKIEDRAYYTVRDVVKFEDMQTFFATNFAKLMEMVKANNLTMVGAPSALYYSWDEKNQEADMAAAFHIDESEIANQAVVITAQFNMKRVIIKEQHNLVLDYYGPYEELHLAHEAMDAYINEKGYTQLSPVIEEYITDPEGEPDPSKWLTRVYYQVTR